MQPLPQHWQYSSTIGDGSYRLESRWNLGVYHEAGCGWWIQGNWAEFCGWISVMEGLPPFVEIGLVLLFGTLCKFEIKLLPKDLSSRVSFQNLRGQTVEDLPVISLLVRLRGTFRLAQSCWSRLYGRHEEKLAEKLAARIEERCEHIDESCSATKRIPAWRHL